MLASEQPGWQLVMLPRPCTGRRVGVGVTSAFEAAHGYLVVVELAVIAQHKPALIPRLESGELRLRLTS